MYLEQHLLSLYRKAFDQQLSSVSPSTKEEKVKPSSAAPRTKVNEASNLEVLSRRGCSATQSNSHKLETPGMEHNMLSNGNEIAIQAKEPLGCGPEEKLLDSGVYRCHSSLSQCSAFATRTSPPADSFDKTLRACHSQPLSMMEVNNVLWNMSTYHALCCENLPSLLQFTVSCRIDLFGSLILILTYS